MFPFNTIVPAPAKVRSLVSHIAEQMHVSPVPTALVDESRDDYNAATIDRVNPETHRREFGIVFPHDPLTVFHSEANLSGVIAHELAHVANDDLARVRSVQRENEFRADETAAKYGYGPQLATALGEIRDDDGGPNIEAMKDHPDTSERIARLSATAPVTKRVRKPKTSEVHNV